MKYYQLFYNNAAGEYYTNQADTEEEASNPPLSYFNEIGIFSDKEIDKAIEDLRGPTVYAVFEDRSAGEGFISEEDNLTGNWRGSKYGYSSLIAEFPAREAAEAAYPQFA